MKIVIKLVLLLVALSSFSYSGYVVLAGPCRDPIEYSLGTFDKRFGITESAFLEAIRNAEKAWEDAVGRDVFAYDPSGDLKIHLIFDERQETALRNKNLESRVDETERTADSVRAEFDSLKQSYETARADYDSMSQTYKTLETTYNGQVEYWNGQGGAPKNEYNKLAAQKIELENMQKLLETRRVEVNRLGEEVNDLVSKYNYLVRTANSAIEAINESADKEFEQGEYIQSAFNRYINIYEFYDTRELIRILAHEFGHALGMGHNENRESIMYYLNKGESITPSAEDIRDFKQACRVGEFSAQERLKSLF